MQQLRILTDFAVSQYPVPLVNIPVLVDIDPMMPLAQAYRALSVPGGMPGLPPADWIPAKEGEELLHHNFAVGNEGVMSHMHRRDG